MVFRLNARRGQVTTALLWEPQNTAVIVCDMWDDHWCKGAARRCSELAPRVNDLVAAARRQGALVVHSPSDTMTFYSGMPQRERAKQAPTVVPPVPIKERGLDPSREPELPIDDSDGGCDDQPTRLANRTFPWKRQHPRIKIAEQDIISESGDEIYNVFVRRLISNVFIAGVHTNKCVLARPFGVRQMVMLGMNSVLVRDLTDSLYNPRRPPYVNHDRGTELVVEHIEKYWCASVLSTDITLAQT
jgi:nicotinamidase-related amidase